MLTTDLLRRLAARSSLTRYAFHLLRPLVQQRIRNRCSVRSSWMNLGFTVVVVLLLTAVWLALPATVAWFVLRHYVPP